MEEDEEDGVPSIRRAGSVVGKGHALFVDSDEDVPDIEGEEDFLFFLFKIDKSVRSQFLIFFEFSIFWRFFSIP